MYPEKFFLWLPWPVLIVGVGPPAAVDDNNRLLGLVVKGSLPQIKFAVRTEAAAQINQNQN